MARLRALDGEVEFRVDHRSNLAILGKRERRRRHCRDRDPRKDGIILFVVSLGSYPRSKERKTRYDIASVSYREVKISPGLVTPFSDAPYIGTGKDRERERESERKEKGKRMDMEEGEKTDRKNMSGKAGEAGCRENETHKKGTLERMENGRKKRQDRRKSQINRQTWRAHGPSASRRDERDREERDQGRTRREEQRAPQCGIRGKGNR